MIPKNHDAEFCEKCTEKDNAPIICKNCSFNPYITKEEIIANADNSDYIHGEVYETQFNDELNNYSNFIGTNYRWTGKVRITIEQIVCCHCGKPSGNLEEHKDIVGGDDWNFWCKKCLNYFLKPEKKEPQK